MILAPGTSGAAAIPVTTTADNGIGSMRAALTSATNGDTIDATGVSGAITLTSGELVITNSVTIRGPGPSALAIDGNYPYATNHVFMIFNGATVSISGLTITNGNYSNGGGIMSFESFLTLSNCAVTGNKASTGGGILNAGFSKQGSLTVINSLISGNSAEVAGGIYNTSQDPGNVTLTVVGSTISSNSAGGPGGGGIKNQGRWGNAKAYITNCTIVGNSSGYGGGILNDGMWGNATIFLVNSSLIGNSASAGGLGGGALFNYDGNAGVCAFISCTLSGNASGSDGGGIKNGGQGGGSATVIVIGSTFSGNTSQTLGGNIYNARTLQIGNTILNAGSSGSNLSSSEDSGIVVSTGYNLSSDNGGGFLTNTTDRIGMNPLLGPLQDNGGPVLTHALLPGSPAIDQGKNLSGGGTDARGSVRTFDDPGILNVPDGDGTDIGAYEAFDLRITAASRSGNDLVLKFLSLQGKNYQIQTRTNLTFGSWTPVGASISGKDGVVEVMITNTFISPQQFYQIQQLP